jgi:methylamine dehydrogenase heavy chain
VVNIYDLETLTPIDEIEVPKKIAALPFRQYIGLMDDRKHLAVFNLTPAQSVSIVDIVERKFVGEIKTPGCSLIMPVRKRTFLQICGDGTLQSIALDEKGAEVTRKRSDTFFDLEKDPIFDKPVPMEDGWLLMSFNGKIMNATNDEDGISLSKAWSLLSDEDKTEKWRPGGGQLITYHQQLDLVFVLMHQGGEDTHEDPGNQIWIFDRQQQRRIAKIELEETASQLLVSQNDEPLLTVTGTDGKLHVFDVRTTKLERSIELPFPRAIQGFR